MTEKGDWRLVTTEFCFRARQPARFMELHREVPAETSGQPEDRVLARACSLAIDCNLVGFPCRWAFTNPDFDPFAPA
jgi:hypothetical protein